MALFDGRRRAAHAERENAALRETLREVAPGATMASPFVTETAPGRSLLPWRRPAVEITEAAAAPQQRSTPPARAGYAADIPRGGATEYNQGYSHIGGPTDRRTLMGQFQQLYVACPWSAACVDTIARTCTAGGIDIVPLDQSVERKEKVQLSPPAAKAQALFEYVNPQENFRQLMRGIFTDLLIYGDSFIEVVWALGEPIALFSLPCPDMLVEADEHGNVTKYVQRTESDQRAEFEPHEVIHIRMDSPRGGLYGLGPTEKCIHPIVTWIQTEAVVKATMQKGNPPNVVIEWDQNLDPNDIKRRSQQYVTQTLGVENIGTPVEVTAGTKVTELRSTQSQLEALNAIKDKSRDEIFGGYGVPPAEATVIESGNLGGGTGTSQRKTFEINTCGPLEELVLEAFTFAILNQGFGVTDFRCDFAEVDWRDDETIERIRTQRVERGGWTLNRYRDEIGEPPVEGGDDAVLILSRDVILARDLSAMSKNTAAKGLGTGAVPELGADGQPTPAPKPDDGALGPTAAADGKDPAHAKGGPTVQESAPLESMTEAQLTEAWKADMADRRRQAMRELV